MEPDAVRAAIQEAGFLLEWMEIEAAGVLVRARVGEEEYPALRIESRDQTWLIVPGESEETRRSHAELSREIGDGASRIRLRGRVHPHPRRAAALAVSTFEKRKP